MKFDTDEISFESLDETHEVIGVFSQNKNLSSKCHFALHLISFQSRETAGKLINVIFFIALEK